jgi:hypothetical protein
MSVRAAARLLIPGSGSARRASSARPPAPTRSLTGQGVPKASRVAWMRLVSAVRWRTRCSRNGARSRSARTPGVGSQISGTRSRRDSSGEHPGVDSVCLAGKRGQAVDLLGVGDGDLEAGQLELVVDEAGAVH